MAKAKDEAKIKFTAETGEFNDQIKEAESSLREMRSELQLNASQMKKTGNNTETLKKRQEILRKELDVSRQKTQALSDKLEKAREIFGDNSEEVKRLQTQLNNAKTAEEKIAREIADTNDKLKKQKTAFDEVADKAEKVGKKLTDAGKKMSVVSAGVAAVGAASVAAFNEVDEGADNVIKATGATGKAAEELEEAYSNVAGQVVGDFASIGEAVGEINTRFGYTGKELEGASLSFQKFSEITGMDAKDAVQAVSRALNDAGIPLDQYDSMLDQLAKAGQAAGIDVATLADSISKNGAVMRGMGFDTEETIALLSQFELSGADSATMLSGMKRAMAEWAEEGKDGGKEFAKTVEGIKNGSVTASDALDIFGTRAGPMLVDAIKSGKFEYQDMLTTIQNSKGTVESTFDGTVDGGYKMELAMQNAKLALADVGDTLSTSLTPFVESATEKLQGFANWWSGLSDGAQKTILTVVGVVAAIGPLLIVFGSVASAISKISTAMKLAKTAFTAAKLAMAGLNLSFLACPITWIIAGIVALVAIFVVLWNKCEGFRNFWKNLWEGIKNACAKAWEGIKKTWSAVTGWFGNVWSGIKDGASKAWNGLKDGAASAWSKVKNTFSNVKGWFRDKFQAAKDAVMNVWSKIKLKLPKIKLPHFKLTGKFSLNPLSVPKLSVQWYKNGGIMTKPTVFGMNGSSFMAGGESGPEAILPIDKLQGYVSTAVERSAPMQDLTPLVRAIEALAGRPIDLSVNGRVFAEATAGDSDAVNGLRNILTERGLILT